MGNRKIIFHPFDFDAEVQVRERNLPHWFQPGVATFITFRTADSMPREVILRNQRELLEWLLRKGLPESLAGWDTSVIPSSDQALLSNLSQFDREQFFKYKDRFFHQTLDECHGECLMSRPDVAKIIFDAILFYNDRAYDLDSFVIMPNHVHAIAQFRTGHDLTIVGQSWMRYTARLINKLIGRIGALWQPEAFDHLIRSDEQFRYLHEYVATNPERAGFKPGSCMYWKSDYTAAL